MIREAVASDIPQISYLLKQILTVHAKGRPDIFKADTQKYTEAEIFEIISDPIHPVYVYEDEDGTVAGYAICEYKNQEETNTLYPRTSIYIDDLCVDEPKRGLGIGTKLYEYVVEKARDEHIGSVTLNAWSCNENAIAFYKKCGMQPMKIMMEKRI